VSHEWLQQHLNDTAVRVITTGARRGYDQGHIPGARSSTIKPHWDRNITWRCLMRSPTR